MCNLESLATIPKLEDVFAGKGVAGRAIDVFAESLRPLARGLEGYGIGLLIRALKDASH